MSKKSTLKLAQEYRQQLDAFLQSRARLDGFEFKLLYPGGDEGMFFVCLLYESDKLEIQHDTPATVFGARDKAALLALAGTEHACEKRNGSALTFEFRDNDHDFSFSLFCTTRLVRFLSMDKKAVKIEVELDLLADHPVSMFGGPKSGDDRLGGVEGPPPGTAKTLILEAEGSFPEFQKEHQKFFRCLTALKKFPTNLLTIERMDTLILGGSPAAFEIGFAPYQMDGQTWRPYLILQDGPALPAGTVQELQGLKLAIDAKNPPEGKMYDLYREGRPPAEIVSMSFGKIKGKTIDCTLELKLALAEIADHNPEHRYKDVVCKLKTRIPVAEGFASPGP